MKKNTKPLIFGVCALAAFVIWTLAVRSLDVRAIGPMGSPVGFSTVNGFFHDLTGVCMPLYAVTDWLGLVPVAFIIGFAVLGLAQWIKRKRISRVDPGILALGGFYIATMAVYIFFEQVVINYRPVLISGILEASYPSSTTLLVLCVIPTAIMQLDRRIENRILKKCIRYILAAFIVFMVAGRTLSGVHWLTDIIGGTLVSTGLVLIYRYVICTIESKY